MTLFKSFVCASAGCCAVALVSVFFAIRPGPSSEDVTSSDANTPGIQPPTEKTYLPPPARKIEELIRNQEPLAADIRELQEKTKSLTERLRVIDGELESRGYQYPQDDLVYTDDSQNVRSRLEAIQNHLSINTSE